MSASHPAIPTGAPILSQTTTGAAVHEAVAGRILRATWDALPGRFPGVDPVLLVIMPDHVHALLAIDPPAGDPAAGTGPAIMAASRHCTG